MAEIQALTIEEFNEYEQIRTPDFAAIAMYVNRAKGTNRTMTQFAEDTQIGASTLSRIVNGKSTKPLSKENIIRIFECRANPDDVHLLEYLANANGMFDKEFVARVKTNDRFAAKRNEEISRQRMMKNSLIASIVSSGLPISRVINMPVLPPCQEASPIVPRRRGDFLIELPPVQNASTTGCIIYTWSFFLFPQIHDELDDERHLTIKNRVQRIIERISAWFLLDAWGRDEVKGDKFSFCFVDENLFEAFVNALEMARVRTEMSVILMSATDYTVKKEVWLHGEYENVVPTNVFEMGEKASADAEDNSEDTDEYDNYEEDTE